MYELILFIIMVSVFIGYNLVIWVLYGILTSISISYYYLPKSINWFFTIFCWGYAFPAIMMAHTGLMFFAGSFICFVGVAAAFKQDKMIAKVHTISAAVAIILSQLSIFLDYKMWWINIIFIVSSLFLFLFKRAIPTWMYWLEVIAFICISYVLFTDIPKDIPFIIFLNNYLKW